MANDIKEKSIKIIDVKKDLVITGRAAWLFLSFIIAKSNHHSTLVSSIVNEFQRLSATDNY